MRFPFDRRGGVQLRPSYLLNARRKAFGRYMQDGGVNGGGFSFDLSSVREEWHAGEDGPQDSRFQKDRDYNCRSSFFDTKVMLALPLFLGELIVLDHIYTTHSLTIHMVQQTHCHLSQWVRSLAAMSVFEAKYKEGLTRVQAIQLVSETICAGIFNDLAISDKSW
ncbi:uncharacterized protein LOC110433935 [Sorghum bicolor]|uniref:uncharacterized protein LOC110433935 n=1 Tax=Sorghum bicolor TaxID=4558 RepID=UPI000B423A0A|nr:uncharacterized protein LOC110433935 [Sorghum bicolor]|eukprot:XP_021312786.1 uncharacterized protein LOC110433935 [Sorghum bicolor]